MDYAKELNNKQYDAVVTDQLHVRIIAGAGSGKTRVLTYRIAFLVSEMGVDPWRILAITFTNKVANEMKERLTKLVPNEAHDITIKTFHSFAAYFLRQEIKVLGFPTSFTIFDEDDQLKLIKDIGSELGIKKTDPVIKKAVNYISKKKTDEYLPEDITIPYETFEGERICLEIYTRYEEAKRNMFALDFDDLLLCTNKILEEHTDIRHKWKNRIDYILIDEFQDTNNTEFKMISLLTRPDTSLYVVGDPDQTIYTWRGANQDIILNLKDKYSDVETIILDQNYRSTGNILNSANKLIANNKLRVKKDLYTENSEGEKIVVKSCSSTRSEADYVARQIRQLVEIHNYQYNDIVILYRSNYITQEFEQSFTANHIPYRIYAGQKFYQRREIKDVIAYFNLIVNTKDDISFERIMNVPKRKIGESSIATIKKEARDAGISMYEYIKNVDLDETEARKAVNILKSMIIVIDKTREEVLKAEEAFSKPLEDMLASFDYFNYLLKEEDGDERNENVKALFEDLRHFLQVNPDATFDTYLQNIALLSSQDEMIEGQFVTLMTAHTAKGLEYPVVFIVRVNQSVFPHQRSQLESGFKGLEEERRLFYVAMTRAKERLYMTFSTDYSYVAGGSLIASQFLKESGNEFVEPDYDYNPYRGNKSKSYSFKDYSEPKVESKPITNVSSKTNGINSWEVGDIVIHKTLGRGVVKSLEGNFIMVVEFDEHGEKTIMGNHPFVSKGEK